MKYRKTKNTWSHLPFAGEKKTRDKTPEMKGECGTTATPLLISKHKNPWCVHYEEYWAFGLLIEAIPVTYGYDMYLIWCCLCQSISIEYALKCSVVMRSNLYYQTLSNTISLCLITNQKECFIRAYPITSSSSPSPSLSMPCRVWGFLFGN